MRPQDCTDDEEGYYGLYSPVTIVSETKKEFGKNRGASAVNSNTGFDSVALICIFDSVSLIYMARVPSIPTPALTR
jgi:hypothetical protein